MNEPIERIGAAGICSLAVAALVAATTIWTLFPLSSEMPRWDQWSMVPVFAAHYAGQPVLPLLLAHYNGHYNWLPRALFYGMGLLSRWDMRLEVAVGFFWAACLLVLLLRMLWEASPRLLVLAAPCAAVVFTTLQFANFLNGYGMGQLLCGFTSVLSLYLLTDPQASRRRFVAALLSAVAAFVSHGAGMALAPAGLAAVLVGRRRSWGRIAAWGGVAAFGVGLGVLGGRNAQVRVAWSEAPRFTLALLGSPFRPHLYITRDQAEVLGGLVLLALGGVVACRAWREWSSRRDLLVRWGSVALMPLCVAALVGVSRSGAPRDWALSTHYVTSTYPVALALTVLVVEWLWTSRDRATGLRRTLLGVALAACCAAPAVQQAVAAYHIVPVLQSWREVEHRITRRMVLGTATDQEIEQVVYAPAADVRAGVQMLRARRLAWFAHAREARRPFGRLERVSGRRPASTMRLREGSEWTFEGWALPPLLALQARVDVALVVDGVSVASAPAARARRDIQEYYGSPALLGSGFALTTPDGGRKPPGRYKVRVVARAGGRTTTLRELELIVLPRQDATATGGGETSVTALLAPRP